MNKRFRLMKSAALLAVLLAPCAILSVGLNAKDKEPVRHWDFQSSKLDSDKIPDGWSYRGNPGTPDVKYEIVEDKELKHKVLHITSDKASGVIMVDCSDVDLKKYPIMRWRWKAVTLPTGADATVKSKDDQGIAVYVGYGQVQGRPGHRRLRRLRQAHAEQHLLQLADRDPEGEIRQLHLQLGRRRRLVHPAQQE